MENILIQTNSKSEIDLLIALAKKMGLKAKHLSKAEIEDWQFGQDIEAGMQSQIRKSKIHYVLFGFLGLEN